MEAKVTNPFKVYKIGPKLKYRNEQKIQQQFSSLIFFSNPSWSIIGEMIAACKMTSFLASFSLR